jgi:hypothetical protein
MNITLDAMLVLPVFGAGFFVATFVMLRPPEIKGSMVTYRWLWSAIILHVALTTYLCIKLAGYNAFGGFHVVALSLITLVVSVLVAAGSVRLRRAIFRLRSERRLKE